MSCVSNFIALYFYFNSCNSLSLLQLNSPSNSPKSLQLTKIQLQLTKSLSIHQNPPYLPKSLQPTKIHFNSPPLLQLTKPFKSLASTSQAFQLTKILPTHKNPFNYLISFLLAKTFNSTFLPTFLFVIEV